MLTQNYLQLYKISDNFFAISVTPVQEISPSSTGTRVTSAHRQDIQTHNSILQPHPL
jgi:hypothetical protein